MNYISSIPFYVFFYLISISFSFFFFSFDAEYFLFFSSLVLFFLVSSTINSFFESLIKARYDIYVKKLELSNFLLSKNFKYSEILENFVVTYNIFVWNSVHFKDFCYEELEEFYSSEEFFNDSQVSSFDEFLINCVSISVSGNLFFNTVNFNSFYETLLFFLIRDHWTWRRRIRINKTYAFPKPFKTPKKFPAVAWPLKPGEYKAPYVVDLL